MSNREILEKAVQKAFHGGWSLKGYKGSDPRVVVEAFLIAGFHTETNAPVYAWQCLYFNHDFAKALWGDFPLSTVRWTESPSKKYTSLSNLPNWQFHLQNMVCAEDPIKYLGDNLPD